jgi:hypothetical protein
MPSRNQIAQNARARSFCDSEPHHPPVWAGEVFRKTCSVNVRLELDDTATVIVWTRSRRGCRDRIKTFTDVRLLSREDRAAILFHLPPSVRTDARDAIDAILPDYVWARERRR